MDGKEELVWDLYQELKKVRAEGKKNYNPENISVDQEKLSKRISRSEHLVNFEKIEIDEEWLNRYFEEYLLELKKFSKENDGVIEKLKNRFKKKELNLGVLIRKVFSMDSDYLKNLACELGVEDKDLFFIGLEMGRPVFELYAEKLKGEIELDSWGEGYCPMCGSSPTMAYLREDDGKRILWCQFCATEWSFMRIKCPFCSNDNHNTLRYFFTDEKSPYRVDICDECKGYVKTIDQRKLEEGRELDLGWESLKTISMDLVAQKEGFQNPYSQPTGKKKGMVI